MKMRIIAKLEKPIVIAASAKLPSHLRGIYRTIARHYLFARISRGTVYIVYICHGM